MAQTLPRSATYDDLLTVPDHMVAEIVDGELFTSPRPASRHAFAKGALSSRLYGAFDEGDGPDRWWIFLEPEIHLGGDVLVPDIAAWRQARMPAIPDVPAFELVPDWICEVVSTTTARLDRVRKLRAYVRHGVGCAWIIDPTALSLEVYVRDGAKWYLESTHENKDIIRAVPFDAIELDLARLWI